MIYLVLLCMALGGLIMWFVPRRRRTPSDLLFLNLGLRTKDHGTLSLVA